MKTLWKILTWAVCACQYECSLCVCVCLWMLKCCMSKGRDIVCGWTHLWQMWLSRRKKWNGWAHDCISHQSSLTSHIKLQSMHGNQRWEVFSRNKVGRNKEEVENMRIRVEVCILNLSPKKSEFTSTLKPSIRNFLKQILEVLYQRFCEAT